MGAIILKWIKEGQIRIDTLETGTLIKKENTVMVLSNADLNSFSNITERKLFSMLLSASGDGILENREFERWCKKNYSKIL